MTEDRSFRFDNIFDGYDERGYSKESPYGYWSKLVLFGYLLPWIIFTFYFKDNSAAVAFANELVNSIAGDEISVGWSNQAVFGFMFSFALFLEFSVYPLIRRIKHSLMEKHKWLAAPGWAFANLNGMESEICRKVGLMILLAKASIAVSIRVLLTATPYIMIAKAVY